MNREYIQKIFADYVRGYDETDPKIALKIKHTYKVAQLCDEIAQSIGLEGEEKDLGWCMGMLHDIGRFEQCRRYDTFNDSISINHAEFGCELLFGPDKLIDRFQIDEKHHRIIYDAIYNHSAYRLPENLDEKTLMYANILRDADKIDIIRANNETPVEEIYNTTHEELISSSITQEVLDSFFNHSAVLKTLKKTPVDNIVGHISLMFELVYPRSRELIKELGYLETMMNFKSSNEDTNRKFIQIREEMSRYLDS